MAQRRSAREILRWRSLLSSSAFGRSASTPIPLTQLSPAVETEETIGFKNARNISAWMMVAGLTAYTTSTALAGSYLSTSTTLVADEPLTTKEESPDAPGSNPSLEPTVKPRVVFVLGGPGSGKGTQCSKIVDDYGFTHLSAGDLLRAELKSGSANGNMIQNMIKEGKIVPAEVTVALLSKAMKESSNDKFLIDGFPRNDENRTVFERDTGINPEFILFFDCPESVMEQRLLNRNQGRVDDNIETIRKRFKTFIESSVPVVDYYDKLGKVRKVNATKSPDEVFKSLSPFFLRFLQSDLLALSQTLLDAIDSGDYSRYSSLCDAGLTAFEPEAQGHLVEGMEFHKFYFDLSDSRGSSRAEQGRARSTMVSPKVTIIDSVGIVTYTRLVQRPGTQGQSTVQAVNETRVWERRRVSPGVWEWKHLHFHRSAVAPA